MDIILLIVFIGGYVFISFEQKFEVNKSAVAILLAFFCWSIVLIDSWHHDAVVLQQLNDHVSDIAQIFFFLMGVMTIVEIIDSYHGFCVISRLIQARSHLSLLWLTTFMTFFLSAFVTTSIIMMTLLHQFLPKTAERLTFASMIIVAANAGGAWTPIGDVTTTMLWIKGYLTSAAVIQKVFFSSLVSVLLPLLYFSFRIKGKNAKGLMPVRCVSSVETNTVFLIGTGALLLVPVLKAVFDLPPYLSVLLGLGLLWV